MRLLSFSILISIILQLRIIGNNAVSNNKSKETVSANNIQKSINSARLPINLEPINYRLEIQPSIEPDFEFRGVVDIEFICKEQTNVIYLNSKDLQYDDNSFELSFKNDPDKFISIRRWGLTKQSEFLVLALTQELQLDEHYVLSIMFAGNIRNDSIGFYSSSYTDINGKMRWMVITKLNPTYARLVFPCFDEPNYKATFNIIIIRPAYMVALSNMETHSLEEREHGLIAEYFKQTPPLSTHQIALAVLDYRFKELQTQSGTLIRIWIEGSRLHQLTTSLGLIPKIFNYYENYFNMRLQLKKIDIISTHSSLIETYWGFITMNSFYLDSKGNELSDPTLSINVGLMLAQGLQTLWIGGRITSRWWEDIWIETGLSIMLSYQALQAIRPNWQIEYLEIIDVVQQSMVKDGSLVAEALSYSINTPSEIKHHYENLIPEKAAMTMKMFQFVFGKETFRKGLQKYLNKYKEHIGDHESFWNSIKEAALDDNLDLEDVEKFYDGWTLQPGYPVITISRNFDTNVTQITQARFVASYDYPRTLKMIDSYEPHWDIPITTITALNPKPSSFNLNWLHSETQSFNELWAPQGQWILSNVMSNGFYRTNYDDENWSLLTKQLLENHEVIEPITRTQLIEDAFQLARGGFADYSLALNISQYLVNETNYLPWKTTLENLSAVLYRLRQTCIYSTFSRYIVRQIYPVYREIGWTLLRREIPLTRDQRFLVLYSSCILGLKDCVKRMKSFVFSWIKNPQEKRIPSSVVDFVFKIAVKYENQILWDNLLDIFINHRKSSNINPDILLEALTSSRNSTNLQRLLDLTLTDSFPKESKVSLFTNIAWQVKGTKLVWDFLKNNWKEIHNYFNLADNVSRTRLVGIIARNLHTEEEESELRQFLNSNENEIEWQDTIFQRDLEISKSNINWNKKYLNTVINWIKLNLPKVERCHNEI